MEPHMHAEETVQILSSDRAWVRFGPSKDDLPNKILLEKDMTLHIPLVSGMCLNMKRAVLWRSCLSTAARWRCNPRAFRRQTNRREEISCGLQGISWPLRGVPPVAKTGGAWYNSGSLFTENGTAAPPETSEG